MTTNSWVTKQACSRKVVGPLSVWACPFWLISMRCNSLKPKSFSSHLLATQSIILTQDRFFLQVGNALGSRGK